MKTNLKIYLAACSVMAALGSCNHEAVVEGASINQDKEARTVTMQAKLGFDSRIAFKENETSLDLLWEENDGFSVMVGKAVQTPITFTLAEGAGTSTGLFEGNINCNDGDTLYAVWPIMTGGMTGEHQCYWSMAGQKGVLDDQYTFMVGSGVYNEGGNTTMSFRHMTAALRMHLELPAGIEKITRVDIMGDMLGHEGVWVNIDSGGLLLDGGTRNDGVTIENEFTVVDGAVDVVAYFFAWDWTYLKNAKVVATSNTGKQYEGALVDGDLRPGKLYDTTIEMTENGSVVEGATIEEVAKNGGTFVVNENTRLTTPLIVEGDMTLRIEGGWLGGTSGDEFADPDNLQTLIAVKPGATLTLEGSEQFNTGHVLDQLSCIRMLGGDAPSKVKINDGMIIGTYYAILIDKGCQNGEVEINGGSLSCDWDKNYNGSAILNKGNAKVNIKGGHIASCGSAVEMWGGQFTMSGGTLQSTFEGEKSHVNTNNEADNCIVGSALAIYPPANHEVTVAISNGTFEGLSSIYEICSSGTPNVSLSVTGGTFEGGINSNNCTGFISGGRFKVQPDNRYLISGKVAVNKGDYYELEDGEATGDLITIQNAELSTALQDVLGAENVKLENGYAVMTKAFAESVETIEIPYRQYTITSLSGIEYFINLKRLSCPSTGLKECNLSKNTKLESVAVWGNSLTTLDLSNQPSLFDINCAQNNTLQTLKINENAKLKYLIIDDTNLQSLVIPNPETIWQLAYSRTPLNLNLTQFTGMEILFCSGNKLTTINLTAAQKLRLTILECDSNSLTSLNLSEYPNLRELSCWRNLIETLDITPLKNLQSLSCGNQQNGIVLQLQLTPDQYNQWESTWSKKNGDMVRTPFDSTVEPDNGNTNGNNFWFEEL